VIEFKTFDQQRAANASINVTAALVFSLSDFVGVESLKIGPRLKMFLENALQGADRIPEFAGGRLPLDIFQQVEQQMWGGACRMLSRQRPSVGATGTSISALKDIAEETLVVWGQSTVRSGQELDRGLGLFLTGTLRKATITN
jgi:hypothetical protein